jgi:hypothetical protein
MEEGRRRDRRSTQTVAIAAIAATALVGIVGSVTTWIVARDDRVSQASLARDERIFEKRSGAYLETLVSAQTLSDDLRLLRFENVPTWPEFQRAQATLRARMTAFASSEALVLYNGMYFGASRVLAAVEGLRQTPEYADPLARSRLWKESEDVEKFETARRQFEFLVAEEIGNARRSSASG